MKKEAGAWEINVERGRSISPAKANPYGTAREEILRAAEILFADQGFVGTTLKDVAKMSGANTALVGYYFGNKEGLRQAVVDLQVRKFEKTLQPLFDLGEKITLADFREGLKRIMEHCRENNLLYKIQLWSYVDGEEYASSMAKELWRPMIDQFYRIIERIRPGLTEADILTRCWLVCGVLQKYADLRWNYLPRLKMLSPSDLLLQSYENLVLDQVIPFVMADTVAGTPV